MTQAIQYRSEIEPEDVIHASTEREPLRLNVPGRRILALDEWTRSVGYDRTAPSVTPCPEARNFWDSVLRRLHYGMEPAAAEFAAWRDVVMEETEAQASTLTENWPAD